MVSNVGTCFIYFGQTMISGSLSCVWWKNFKWKRNVHLLDACMNSTSTFNRVISEQWGGISLVSASLGLSYIIIGKLLLWRPRCGKVHEILTNFPDGRGKFEEGDLDKPKTVDVKTNTQKFCFQYTLYIFLF